MSAWTQDYLSTQIVGLKAEKDGVATEVSKILSMDGDVDVSQRKGKVITIFDVRLQLEWQGKVAVAEVNEKDDGSKETVQANKDVSGTITIPEVAHDTEEDEYVVRLSSHISHCLQGSPFAYTAISEANPWYSYSSR